MKIFNWVHRRFHQKDGFGRDVKKAEFAPSDADTQALLDHVALADVFDGWKEGILSIGTLGIGPLKDFNPQKKFPFISDGETEEEEEEADDSDEEEYSVVEDVCNEIDEEEEGEMNPLIFKAFEHGIDSHCAQNGQVANLILNIDCIPLSPRPHEIGLDLNKKKKGERTTLAELFSADSDMHTKEDHGKVRPDSIKKPNLHGKNGLWFAKKLIPRVGEDSRPIQKLQRMMTKMMKRKIHPDVEGNIQKKESQIKPSELRLLKDEYGTNESVSLLQTQVQICVTGDSEND